MCFKILKLSDKNSHIKSKYSKDKHATCIACKRKLNQANTRAHSNLHKSVTVNYNIYKKTQNKTTKYSFQKRLPKYHNRKASDHLLLLVRNARLDRLKHYYSTLPF